jgi:hypothetical protein
VEKAGDQSPLLDQAYAIGDLTAAADKNTEPDKPAGNEPQNGSFERFLGSFGTPGRWAGAN